MLRTGVVQRLLRNAAAPPTSGRRPLATLVAPAPVADESDEYTKEAQYPPIEERSYEANLVRKREQWYSHIRELTTVEEKLLALNMPRYYGYKCLMLTDQKFPYDCLPLVQHSTRTLLHADGLPEAVYAPLRQRAEQFVPTIRDDIQTALAFETIGYQPGPEDPDAPADVRERARHSRIVQQVHRAISNALAADVEHLRDTETDLDARHEAFWFVGGIAPPANIRNLRSTMAWQKPFADEPVNRQFQYVGRPLLTVRHALPLRPHRENAAFAEQDVQAVPHFPFDPRTIGYAHAYRHGVTVPGFWPGAQHEFGTLAYLSRSHLATRSSAYGDPDNRSALDAQAILGSYAWLLGQACYQGFSIFTDPTYALSTQTIVTDGRDWSFYAYQLNTTQTHQDAFDGNQKCNECWSSGERRLYERVEPDGTVLGWNDEVLRTLIEFYLNAPAKRAHAMQPFLGTEEQRVAQIEHAERREFVESRYKNVVSNRPRHRLVPEIYQWEKIYKIDNKTLPLVPKRRFFELYENPFQRQLDDHTPVYVPKAVRPGGPKNKVNKWEKKFYPTQK